MKQIKKTGYRLIMVVSGLLARLLAFLIQLGPGDFTQVQQVFERKRLLLLRHHYYLPIPDEDDMNHTRRTDLPGIDMRDEQQLQFTDEMVLPYKSEFKAFPLESTRQPDQFYLLNGRFMAGDGNLYYGMIRSLKPRHMIEIGSGMSTLLALHAIEQNRREQPADECLLTSIEPYPGDALRKAANLDLIPHKLQQVELSLFDRLDAGDILFIDSSHVLKSGGDVWLEYCEIIPRLHSGVYIHIHDISLPKPYPPVYYDQHLYWNEQYLLQALLTGSQRLEVVWAGTYLCDKYPQRMLATLDPEYAQMRSAFPQAEPSSFWMRVR